MALVSMCCMLCAWSVVCVHKYALLKLCSYLFSGRNIAIGIIGAQQAASVMFWGGGASIITVDAPNM